MLVFCVKSLKTLQWCSAKFAGTSLEKTPLSLTNAIQKFIFYIAICKAFANAIVFDALAKRSPKLGEYSAMLTLTENAAKAVNNFIVSAN